MYIYCWKSCFKLHVRVHLLLGQVTHSPVCMMSAQISLVVALDSVQHSYTETWWSTRSFVSFNSCGSCCSCWHPVSAVVFCCIALVPSGLHASHASWLSLNSCIPFVSFSAYESPWFIGPFGPVALLVLKLLAILYTLCLLNTYRSL